MDELSLYVTIAATLLILVSYFWLLTDDLKTRKLTKEKINYELAVVLANADHRIAEELGRRLDEFGFKVYGLCFGEDKELRVKNDTLHLNLRQAEHLDLVSKFFEDELKNSGKRLHAYISLPISSTYGKQSPPDWHQLIQESLLPHSQLIVSLTNLISMHKTRIISSSLEVASSKSPPDSPALQRLASSLFTSICGFLFANQLERGQCGLTEVRVCKRGSEQAGIGRLPSNSSSKGFVKSNTREKQISEQESNGNDQLDEELVAALVVSTLRVRPQQQVKIVIG